MTDTNKNLDGMVVDAGRLYRMMSKAAAAVGREGLPINQSVTEQWAGVVWWLARPERASTSEPDAEPQP